VHVGHVRGEIPSDRCPNTLLLCRARDGVRNFAHEPSAEDLPLAGRHRFENTRVSSVLHVKEIADLREKGVDVPEATTVGGISAGHGRA